MPEKLYEKLVVEILRSIDDGVLQPGDRLPSIRETAGARRLSITTVKRAYQALESQGAVEGRPKAGYFVRAGRPPPALPLLQVTAPEPVSAIVDVGRFVLSTLKRIQSQPALPLGAPYPDPALFNWRRVYRRTDGVARRLSDWNAMEDLPPGHPELIRQIARRHLRNGLDVDPNEIVVTAGATEAINLCLQAVARPGDTIAVESPTYYAMLQAIERMGMRAIELPTDPQRGIDVEALARLLERQRIDACLTMPNFQNPQGFLMPDERKRALVELATRHDMPLIEDGVYNELYYGAGPPTTLKAFDTQGIVLHCGSFSKSLTAGVRIGWALAGRYREQVERLKFINTHSTSALAQQGVAEYLANDGWDHQLRGVRQALEERCALMRSMVCRFFPEGTRMSQPRGGYLLWIELPGEADSLALYREALDRGISIAPGRVFSNTELYRRFLRLNYSHAWSPQIEEAVKTLARIAGHAGRGDGSTAPPDEAAPPLARPAQGAPGC